MNASSLHQSNLRRLLEFRIHHRKAFIVDPEGVEAELPGYDGAVGGKLTIPFDFASNDRTGVWEIQAKELASGKEAAGYVRLIARYE